MRNKYSFAEFISTVYSLMLTKIFFNKARLLRRPVYIRGKSSIVGGINLTTGHFCRFDLDGFKKTLFIGDNCEFGDNTHIVALNKVIIGNNVLIASNVFISDTNHGCYIGNTQSPPYIAPNFRFITSTSTEIGDNVWIGENVCVLPGVHIGYGCIIGANSVVTKDVPNEIIAVGSPAKPLKRWCKETNSWIRIGMGK